MKFKSFYTAHRSLINDVITSTCLIGASSGIVFGISAAKFKINYMDLEGAQDRLNAAKNNNYYSQAIKSQWNMNIGTQDGKTVPALEAPIWRDMKAAVEAGDQDAIQWWLKAHGNVVTLDDALWKQYDSLQMSTSFGDSIEPQAIKNRYEFTSMVIDGATHTTLDRSFNQSLYTGLVDFNNNSKVDHIDSETEADPINKNIAHSYKPTQDNTTDFVNTYSSVIEQHRIVGLAGFNHSTPLNAMMYHDVIDGGLSPIVSSPNKNTNKAINKTAFILLDSDVPNNQNVASVQFRSDQPGFLAALSACQYFYNNLDMYHDHYQNISVGAFGGVAIPTVMIYMGGFQRGIELFNYAILENILSNGAKYWFMYETGDEFKAADEENYNLYRFCYDEFDNLVAHGKYKNKILELRTTKNYDSYVADYKQKMYDEYSIKMIKLGSIDTHFSGTFSAGDAIGITKQFLNRSASAIIAVAGPQSLDAAQEIRNQNSKCIVIGVDTAMEDGDYQRYHAGCSSKTKTIPNKNDPYMDKTVSLDGSVSQQSNAIIKFSAVKDIRTVSQKIAQLAAEGKNWDVSKNGSDGKLPDPDKSICGPGFQTCGNIKNGLISVSWDGFPLLYNALSHITFNDGTRNLTFHDAWKTAVSNYADILTTDDPNEAKRLLKEGYWEDVLVPERVSSFKRNDDEGNPRILYSNFNHTIAILGQVCDILNIVFTPDMTVVRNDAGELVVPQENQNLSINEWLDYNMYFMC